MSVLNKTKFGEAAGAEVVHRLPGRVRVLVPGLKGDRLKAAGVVQRLGGMTGVHQAQASPLTGRVLVIFNTKLVKEDSLIRIINNINT
ncbi:MAG: hypothetical protein K6U74_13040, partial [Firmicutes bacterium]|nr:hypothetical protein [Bacillota bacterium]